MSAKNYPERVRDDGIGVLPDEIEHFLNRVSTMPGDPAKPLIEEVGFHDIRKEGYKKGRGVYIHTDTPQLVYKVGVGRGQWQNGLEASIWEDREHPSFDKKIPEKTLDYLIPVLESDQHGNDTHWLIMPEASMNLATKQGLIELMEGMIETGWAVTDHHPDNVGVWKDLHVFVDYGQLRPVRQLRDEWREAIDAYNME